MKQLKDISVEVAAEKHLKYVDTINDTIDMAAKQRGTGIARRTHEYLARKITEGKAIIALEKEEFAGFCYIESWGTAKYVANSGLIVSPEYRGIGLATEIKRKAFELSRKKFPDAKLFGLTTGLAVMKINHSLGYRPVTFSELTDDDAFWNGCQGCVNYDILQRTNRTKCLCTSMLYDPAWETGNNGNGNEIKKRSLLETISKFNPKNTLILLKKYRENKKTK
ncbi:MAG TPA: GNAT family N-acetyltransferase [Prolixibacteraceae bacterium]|nr:GNAT family N-acetyltransferase [Prolixibacteraceae bacterium]HOS00989.1 GNAT family N-acetyltransferase [Prolixibacteraceae bacterium]HPL46076.1 GNAT family N-acetyltransferase [Prolixibacteraceae bacterium]HQE52283.1 GNAT family N-acetyltransferase [Prolixibacteraceae bacterium]HQH76901.1 GNAT family N-acetyltransferase [Prolixibacteraceae bacterium]